MSRVGVEAKVGQKLSNGGIVRVKGIIPFTKSFHPEFNGYLAEEGNGVIISFIYSKQEGRGNFSRLLKELKAHYDWIKIPTPSNKMKLIATRKGFVLKMEYFPEPFNEWGEMLLWAKQKIEK